MALLTNGKKGIFLSAILLVAQNLLALHGVFIAALAQQLLCHSVIGYFFSTTIIHINGNQFAEKSFLFHNYTPKNKMNK